MLLGIAALALFPVAIVATGYYIHLLETTAIRDLSSSGSTSSSATPAVSRSAAGLFGIGAYAVGVMVTSTARRPGDADRRDRRHRPLRRRPRAAGTARHGLSTPSAMATLALGTIIQILINEMTFLTEGPLGIKLTKAELLGISGSTSQQFWLVAALLVLSLVVRPQRALPPYLGRPFEALRGSPVAAGLPGRLGVPSTKVYAFVIGAGPRWPRRPALYPWAR